MKLFLFIITILISACKQENASTLSSGTLQDKINSDATISLNYRIDPQAVSSHQSLILLNQLKNLNENKIPSAWDFPTLVRINQLLNYLHSKSNTESVRSVSLSEIDPFKKIIFHLEKEDFIIITNKEVNELRWISDSGDVVTMKNFPRTIGTY